MVYIELKEQLLAAEQKEDAAIADLEEQTTI